MPTYLLISSLFASAIIISLCPTRTNAQVLQGTIVDNYSREPVSGAHVTADKAGAVSNEQGTFVLSGLASDTYTLRISKVGYQTTAREVTVTTEPRQILPTISLQPEVVQLNREVIVSAQRAPQTQFESPYPVSVLGEVQLTQYSPRSSAEALEGLTGVWTQKTNHGGGSPFVRGLTGNQTLLMVDGIRLNNAISRYGPNQYFNTIDPNSIERVEVVRGSGSVQYGSDALGGVVQVLTKTPTFSPDGWQFQGNLYAKYMSGGMERSGRSELTLSNERVALYGGVSIRHFGDLIAGGGRTLTPSGYQEASVDSKALVKLTEEQQLTVAYQRLQQNDVHRWDQVAQRGYALWKFDPQIRHLGYVRWQWNTGRSWWKTIRVTTSLNRSVEERVTRRVDNTSRRHERDAVNTYGAQLEVLSQPTPNYRVTSGLEYYTDRVYSRAWTVDVATADTQPQRSTYPDGAQATSLALFSLHSWRIDRWVLNYGARLNTVRVKAADEIFGQIKNAPTALVGNAGVSYALHPHYRLVASVSTGFRAPNIDDLTKFGSFDSGFEVPIRGLAPERSVTTELGIKAKTDQFSGTLVTYYTRLFDLIERTPSTYQGNSQLNGEPVFQKQNVAAAYLRGLEAEVAWHMSHSFTAFGSGVYTYGQNATDNEPMRRIPPLHGRFGLQWEHPAGWNARGEWRYAAAQRRLSGGDSNDHRIADGGTNGWQIINLYAGYTHARFGVNVGLQNLLDRSYRTHGSGVDGYGRSGWVAVRWHF